MDSCNTDTATDNEYETADDDDGSSNSDQDTGDEWTFLLDEDLTSDQEISPPDHDLTLDQDTDDEWTSLLDEDLISDQENSPLLLDLTSEQGTSSPDDHLACHAGEEHRESFRREAESADGRDILGRRWLSDDVIDLAQDILQTRFPQTRGLYAFGAAFTLPPLQLQPSLFSCRVVNHSVPLRQDSMADYGRLAGTHWMLLSSYGARRSGHLAVYDSMYNSLSACTTALMEQLQDLHVPPPHQNDGYSCGLFALAFAFSIAVGQDPCTVRYDLASKAPHLVRCLERGVVQPFPSVPVG
ncbi:hypothetical protein O3P69_000824 [Scylla paramamosain]|uniref:Ubiquitin-like protease family profile domain-containing protein n=1 Tax=Scylla paramamosain TaxID=85552 RepID=A0AAW0URI4_SCYPA